MLTPKSSFYFDPGTTYLNHGSFGATPREVMETRFESTRRFEADPWLFMKRDWHDQWSQRCALVSDRFGVSANDLALVANVTDGVNAVMRSLDFAPGDEILTTSMVYDAVKISSEYTGKLHGAKISTVVLPFPDPNPDRYVEAIRNSITPNTKLVILDHISAGFALAMPIREMTKACHDKGVPVLVDGAHVPGNIPLDMKDINAEWYVGNLHKWHFVPRSCGFLWRNPNNNRTPRDRILPNIMSRDIVKGFPNSFAYTGTSDPGSWMSIPAAFKFMDSLGGTDAVMSHNHQLMAQTADLLSSKWDTPRLVPSEMMNSMTIVALPKKLPFPSTAEGLRAFDDTLLAASGIALISMSHNDYTWSRITAQVYNNIDDYKKLAEAVLEICKPGWRPHSSIGSRPQASPKLTR